MKAMLSVVVKVVGATVGIMVAALHAQVPPSVADRPQYFMQRSGVLESTMVTLRLVDVTLDSALKAVGHAGKVRLVYSRHLVPLERRVSLRATEKPVLDVLQILLRGTGLEPRVAATGQIILRRPNGAAPDVGPAVGDDRLGVIVGRVTNAVTGEPLVAVDVSLERTRWRTITDTGGRYRLAEIDMGNYTLIARRIGYASQSRQVVVSAEGIDTVNLALSTVATSLDELVSTATGQQRRRDIGNAITTIRADSILSTAPIRNLTDLLADRVPGLTVQRTSGAPGDPAKLRLRGIGSALRSNDPVFIVDGVRVYAEQSGPMSGNLTNLAPGGGSQIPAPSPLDQIDPNAIEKVEVFKGPSAATLYGADAANGVIVITTKRGRPGPSEWTANLSYGRTTTPGRYRIGTYRFGHDDLTDVPRACTIQDPTCHVDSLVQLQLLNDPNLTVLGRGQSTNLSLTVSGGTQSLSYRVTGTYADETGGLRLPAYEVERFRERFSREAPDWMQRPHQLTKWNVGSTIMARINPTMDVTLTTSMARDEQQRTALESQLSRLAGTYIDTINGIYRRAELGNGEDGALLTNTGAILDAYYRRTTASSLNITSSLAAKWQPWSWFNASGQAGLNIRPRDDQQFLPAGLVLPTDSGALTHATGRSLVSTLNVQGMVQAPLRWGFMFQTSLGANLTTTTVDALVASGSRLTPGSGSIGTARAVSIRDARSASSIFGWYIEPRVTGQRLSLSTGLRLDGGNTYGTNVKLLSLPKLNASWVISEEPFFPFKSMFSSLRLRGAYGQAQVQPGPADRLRLYAYSLSSATLGRAPTISAIGNPDLRPERSSEFEGGFDADLLDSRVSLGVTAYRKNRVDALMKATLPLSLGAGTTVLKNVGTIRNSGIELTATFIPVRSDFMTWSVDFIYARNRNVLTELGAGVQPDPLNGLVAGYPVASRWAKPILGIADQNDDGVIQRGEFLIGDTLVYVGLLYPEVTLSFFPSVSLFHSAVQVTGGFSYDGDATKIDNTLDASWVLSRALVDPNTPASEQAAVIAGLQHKLSPGNGTEYGLMQAVSVFQFNSLAINYRAPVRLAQLFRAQRLSIGVQGSNLAIHTNYRGRDPNVSSYSQGESIVDNGQLPLPRTWALRLSLVY